MEILDRQVANLRQSSRQVVRELGFMQTEVSNTGLTHSQCHALLELEQRGQLELVGLSDLLRLDKSTGSRLVAQLMERGWVKAIPHPGDRRRKPLVLTPAGHKRVEKCHAAANPTVANALKLLTEAERAAVLDGMALYAKALARARSAAEYEIRPIQRKDNPAVARIIKSVMPEFGASGCGFAINDPEVTTMYEAYSERRHAYFVIVHAGRVVGGAGIGPLKGGKPDTCELRKMYFLPELRGRGLGQTLIDTCLEAARRDGFKRCYLETLEQMHQARSLYEKNGFSRLSKPMGDTGHFSCNMWYSREL